ncbi:hypothetical protein EVAR_51594_1 [Eumeta japonica]|uniref:Uncharacterized protein n=1 Tax=Eumeta variegata TaxID=151549 RepID=A0A4C1YJU6_EUMVA|nr:hypothetical protein EVAR_51594_1 [Eumeta japonica]
MPFDGRRVWTKSCGPNGCEIFHLKQNRGRGGRRRSLRLYNFIFGNGLPLKRPETLPSTRPTKRDKRTRNDFDRYQNENILCRRTEGREYKRPLMS